MGTRNFAPRHRRESSGRAFNGRKHIEMLYSTPDWQKYRVRFLNENPYCYADKEPATVVDHLIPHQGNLKLFWKEDNFLPLCKKCHDTVTALFDRRYRAGNSIDNKLRWLKSMRVTRDLSHRVKIVPLGDLLLKIQTHVP